MQTVELLCRRLGIVGNHQGVESKDRAIGHVAADLLPDEVSGESRAEKAVRLSADQVCWLGLGSAWG